MPGEPFLPDELHPGDLVVDLKHGVGLYHGLSVRATPVAENAEPVEREYLVVEYDGGDRLYVPADQSDRVRPYVGSAPPKLNRLRGRGWASAVAKARESVRQSADKMAALYAERAAARGHACAPDTPEQRRMEEAFPYQETPHQKAAIEDVKRDMEQPRPMDRLLVGDVGFGKTEVAVRAAFKMAQEGRQATVLCPTAVLASQHYATFQGRLAPFGVRTTLLSRFQSAADQAEALEAIASGAAQVVVGTHRLLSEDVHFHDLGLLIVDEEQRFGVLQKERLKELRTGIDVLSMSATPIPRTLELAMSGLRDVSLISDPPPGRTPVETTVNEFREDLIRDAIRRELGRQGQVFTLHNRVETIEDATARVQALVPEARVRAAHGQMPEAELEEVMNAFTERRFDVLVSTTIVESGIDIPNANTLIVDHADQFGLAQLYQLRGRVGRSDQQAYALFLYREAENLSEVARRRLAALQEFSTLGAGEQIAVRDLELRGAGTLLGLDQSGPATAVGLDLYLRLLEAAAKRRRGEKPEARRVRLPEIDLPVSSGLPQSYIADERERFLRYRKIASVRSAEEAGALRDEIQSRYGPAPSETETLFELLDLRLRCRELGIKEVGYQPGRVTLRLRLTARGGSASENGYAQRLGPRLVAASDDSIALSAAPEEAVAVLEEALRALKQPEEEGKVAKRPSGEAQESVGSGASSAHNRAEQSTRRRRQDAA